jgi:excisionase family DNA binding protein
MNKHEAASFLGITERGLEYHVKQGNISQGYVRGKTGDVADFSEAELKKLRRKIDQRRTPRAAIARDENPEDAPRSLMSLRDAPALADLLARLLERPQLPPAPSEPTITDLSHKLVLKLSEAAQLSGLSHNHLREAIRAGKLKSRIIGRGFKVKRSDLDAYVRKL